MKRIILTATIMIISMSLIGCNKSSVSSDENQTTNESTNNNQNSNGTTKISIEEAKDIALKHANLASDKVTFIKTESNSDNGVEEYDIEFYHENTEYDYEINATTGEIIEYDNDVKDYDITNDQNSNGAVKISMEEAKNIALNHANLISNQVTFIKTESDSDNGVEKYDIEFNYQNVEYNYEINAATGQIIEYNQEVEN